MVWEGISLILNHWQWNHSAGWLLTALSSLPWFLLYLWVVGFAYRSRSLALWLALLCYIVAGVYEAIAALQSGQIILGFGPASRTADLIFAVALLTFLGRRPTPTVRLRLITLAFTFGISGIYALTIWSSFNLQPGSAEVGLYLYVTFAISGNTALQFLEIAYFLVLAVMLASFPFIRLNVPGWELVSLRATKKN